MANGERNVTMLDAISRCARYKLIDRLAYLRMASNCGRGSALLFLLSDSIKARYACGACRLVWNMAVDSLLALATIGRLAEIEWSTLEDPESFP